MIQVLSTVYSFVMGAHSLWCISICNFHVQFFFCQLLAFSFPYSDHIDLFFLFFLYLGVDFFMDIDGNSDLSSLIDNLHLLGTEVNHCLGFVKPLITDEDIIVGCISDDNIYWESGFSKLDWHILNLSQRYCSYSISCDEYQFGGFFYFPTQAVYCLLSDKTSSSFYINDGLKDSVFNLTGGIS